MVVKKVGKFDKGMPFCGRRGHAVTSNGLPQGAFESHLSIQPRPGIEAEKEPTFGDSAAGKPLGPLSASVVRRRTKNVSCRTDGAEQELANVVTLISSCAGSRQGCLLNFH